MSDEHQLERRLRAALHAQARTLDPSAEHRLIAGDYHPNTRRIPSWRWSRPLGSTFSTLIAAATVVAVAIAALLLTLTGSNPAPAQAAWTAIPSLASAADIANAMSYCIGAAIPATSRQRQPQSFVGSGKYSGTTITPLLAERRGLTTVVLGRANGPSSALEQAYGNGADGQLVACMLLGHERSSNRGGELDELDVSTLGLGSQPTPGANQIQSLWTSERSGTVGATLYAGRVGRDVQSIWLAPSPSAVAPTLEIKATIQAGYYLVWWPSSEHPHWLSVQTHSGSYWRALPRAVRVTAYQTCAHFNAGRAHPGGLVSCELSGRRNAPAVRAWLRRERRLGARSTGTHAITTTSYCGGFGAETRCPAGQHATR